MAFDRDQPTMTAGDFLEILFRHKKVLLLFPACVFLMGALVVLFFPRTYRSEAKLFLQVGRESVGLDPTATTGKTMSLMQSGRDDEVKSAIDILRSRGIVSQAVDLVGPDVVLGRAGSGVGKPSPVGDVIRATLGGAIKMIKSIDPVSDREEAIIRVEKKLKIDAERDSTVVLVRFDAKTPQLAQEVCDAIVNVYRSEHMRIHRNADSSAFFEDQRELLRKQLDEAVEKVRVAKNEMELATIEGRRETLESQLSEIQLEAFRSNQELTTSEARVADLEKQVAAEPERMVASKTSVPNQGRDLKGEQLYALQMQAMDLRARYSDSHPLVEAIEQQIRDADQVLNTDTKERLETTDDVNPIHRQLSLDLKQQLNVASGYAARLEMVREQERAVVEEIKQLNRHEVRLDQLQREESIARTKFFQYAESLEQARIDQRLASAAISNVSVAQPATLSEKPVSPSKLLVGLATIVLAVGGSASLILGSERLNDRLRNDEEIERALDLPVFAAIPRGSAPSRVLSN
jgi:uncharacterized protein involved in exopolysaccharide biosynthesis